MTAPAPPEPLLPEVLTRWSAVPLVTPPQYGRARDQWVVQQVRPPGADASVVLFGPAGAWDVTTFTRTSLDHRVDLPGGLVPRGSVLSSTGILAVTACRPGRELARLFLVPAPGARAVEVPGLLVRPAQVLWSADSQSLVVIAEKHVAAFAVHRSGAGVAVEPMASPAAPGDLTTGSWRLSARSDAAVGLSRRFPRGVQSWAWEPARGTGGAPRGWQETTPELDWQCHRLLAVTTQGLILHRHEDPSTLLFLPWESEQPEPVALPAPWQCRHLRAVHWADETFVLRLADQGVEHLLRCSRDPSTGRLDSTNTVWSGAPGETVLTMTVLPGGRLWWSTGSVEHPCRVHLEGRSGPLATSPQEDLPRLLMDIVTAEATDGTPVTMHRARPRETSSAPLGTLVTCYGGFGVAHQLEAAPTTTAWAALGGTMVAAQVRGGGEQGQHWHQGGSGGNKLTAVSDLVSCLETLHGSGPDGSPVPLVLIGASHGGWLAAMAALTAPHLLAGVVLTAPLLDITDIHRHGYGRHWIEEFGLHLPGADPQRLSPLHLLRQAPAAALLPPFLINSPQQDERVDPQDAVEWTRILTTRGVETRLRREPGGHAGNGRASADARTLTILDTARRWCRAARPQHRRTPRTAADPHTTIERKAP